MPMTAGKEWLSRAVARVDPSVPKAGSRNDAIRLRPRDRAGVAPKLIRSHALQQPPHFFANRMADADEDKRVDLSDAASYLLEECRMVLPGIQAIFGFQLIAVFNQRFPDLEQYEQGMHFVAMTLNAVAIAMVMCPAAYHRMRMPFEVTHQFIRNSSRLLLAAMFPLGLGMAMDYYIIARLVFEHTARGWLGAAAVAFFAVLSVFWFVFPKSRAMQQMLDRKPWSWKRRHTVS
jgi:Family of unknown function (DUF6328)